MYIGMLLYLPTTPYVASWGVALACQATDILNLALPAFCVHVASRGCLLPCACACASLPGLENGESVITDSHMATCIQSVLHRYSSNQVWQHAVPPDLLERQCVVVAPRKWRACLGTWSSISMTTLFVVCATVRNVQFSQCWEPWLFYRVLCTEAWNVWLHAQTANLPSTEQKTTWMMKLVSDKNIQYIHMYIHTYLT